MTHGFSAGTLYSVLPALTLGCLRVDVSTASTFQICIHFDVCMLMSVLPILFKSIFTSVPSIDRQGHQSDMRDDSAEILFQSFLYNMFVWSNKHC